LCSATSVNAALLGRPELGRIAIGARGDLLVLEANPLEQPDVLWDERKLRTVVQAGRVLS
jgi:imidazolonepropionase-like amidohydrolase